MGKALRETIRSTQATESESQMLREALLEQKRITRDWEDKLEVACKIAREQEERAKGREAELAKLRETIQDQESIIQKFQEEEKERKAVEAESQRLKRKHEEEEQKQARARKTAGVLSVPYELGDDGRPLLGGGLVRLRQSEQLCDAVFLASGGRRVAVHLAVLAASSS